MPLNDEIRPTWVLVVSEVDQSDKLVQRLCPATNLSENPVAERSGGGERRKRLVCGVQPLLVRRCIEAAGLTVEGLAARGVVTGGSKLVGQVIPEVVGVEVGDV